jgi:hypothetical protein
MAWFGILFSLWACLLSSMTNESRLQDHGRGIVGHVCLQTNYRTLTKLISSLAKVFVELVGFDNEVVNNL